MFPKLLLELLTIVYMQQGITKTRLTHSFIYIHTSRLILEIIKETKVKMYDKVLNTTKKKRITHITFNYLRKSVNKKS